MSLECDCRCTQTSIRWEKKLLIRLWTFYATHLDVAFYSNDDNTTCCLRWKKICFCGLLMVSSLLLGCILTDCGLAVLQFCTAINIYCMLCIRIGWQTGYLFFLHLSRLHSLHWTTSHFFNETKKSKLCHTLMHTGTHWMSLMKSSHFICTSMLWKYTCWLFCLTYLERVLVEYET